MIILAHLFSRHWTQQTRSIKHYHLTFSFCDDMVGGVVRADEICKRRIR